MRPPNWQMVDERLGPLMTAEPGWQGSASRAGAYTAERLRYRAPVATVMPISDRRARLALVLAVLGVPSLGITVPSAIWLGFRAVRQQRLSSGAEPAMGFIALVVAGLDIMTLNSVLLKTFDIIDPQLAWTGIGWGVGARDGGRDLLRPPSSGSTPSGGAPSSSRGPG